MLVDDEKERRATGGGTSAIAACVSVLGRRTSRIPGALIVSVAMRDCLRKDGWYAYDETPVA